ncbi:acetoacetate--CoA ligase [Actinomadura macra]|uniref:acetoacetate--CoA ligase n=1 Tax=Actinomadura macra TaxID=46164 RepID=UPI00082A0F3E|nr:acetoacetate--CoA ligase [Actinomadura macra]
MNEAEILSTPDPQTLANSRLGGYLRWLESERGLVFGDYHQLWRWSVQDLDGFWSSIWSFFDIRAHTPPRAVVGRHAMPGATWFPGSTLNYAEHATGLFEDRDRTAVIAHSQTRPPIELTFGELGDRVARVRAALRRLGVRRGDRVVAYLPNIPETLVAFLATASLGAIWASCAPEFGPRAVIDRFAQLRPAVLLTITGYRYGDRDIDRRAQAAVIRAALPTVRHTIHIPYGGDDGPPGTLGWPDLLTHPPEPGFEPVPFDHPLFVLFSSGTTGPPKAIVHGHGGILIEHLKNHALSWDLHPGDRMLWFTSTAWMLWNAQVSALLLRASIVMIDGNPMHPDPDAQWRLAAQTRATLMGVSPGYITASRRHDLHPARDFDLSALRQLSVAGSPLSAEGSRWAVRQLGDRVLLNVGSGGTDVCSGLLQGGPMQPVRAGQISGPCLGVAAHAYDPRGEPVVGELGELVITEPMPSMPVGFWDDRDGSQYRAAYFQHYPGVWRHGDWVRFAPQGHCVVTGRSDATLNRGGIRLGTAEFYAITENLPEIHDSLVVHLDDPHDGIGELLLFVVAPQGLDNTLRKRLAQDLRDALSPRHVPDVIVAVPAIPRTLTGKKLEVPVKRILLGAPAEQVVGPDTVTDPRSLAAFVAHARRRSTDPAANTEERPRI